MIVYVVSIESETGESTHIDSVYATEDGATMRVKELSSALGDDMVATYEAHEVYGS